MAHVYGQLPARAGAQNSSLHSSLRRATAGRGGVQARAAVAQLYEYRYRHKYPGASLWLVFSMKPSTDWLVEYLAGDRGINVLWVESGQLAGPLLHLLMES